MTRRGKITIIAGFLLALVVFLILAWPSADNGQKEVDVTRRALQAQGFRTELSEFNFMTADDFAAHAHSLKAMGHLGRPSLHRDLDLPDDFNLMGPVGPDSVMVLWQQPVLLGSAGESVWPIIQEVLESARPLFDNACESTLAGPIHFNLDASKGVGILLPHLTSLRDLNEMLAIRAMYELHEGRRDAAWTNLLAATRLVTAYDPESIEISHLLRFMCVRNAFNATWQALQSRDWSDDQLARLQREWETADFLSGLPETAAFQRASMADMCQRERKEPGRASVPFGDILKEAPRAPRSAWNNLKGEWKQRRYYSHGTYEDEKAVLLFYRDRELELRDAVKATTWAAMQKLPGVTNSPTFDSKYDSRLKAMMQMRKITHRAAFGTSGPTRKTFVGGAAEAESCRRVIITAIALERHRVRHGSYPADLAALTPDLLKVPLADFIDGQPLRYRLTADGHFVLYSVGLDGNDNGGVLPPTESRRAARSSGPGPGGVTPEADLVWPRPASAAEIGDITAARVAALHAGIEQDAEREATAQWGWTAWRQAQVEKILAAGVKTNAGGLTCYGRPLTEVLKNSNVPADQALTLDEMLTLQAAGDRESPERITFELPISYDALASVGSLRLLVDSVAASPSGQDSTAGFAEAMRASNGNCLLVWNTIYECPGKHALQVVLEPNETAPALDDVHGPLLLFVCTNLCQFNLACSTYNTNLGALLHAKLPEARADYTIELTAPKDGHLKTIRGITSNGILKEFWDLRKEDGTRFTNDLFSTVFHITLPQSGRSQTLNGP